MQLTIFILIRLSFDSFTPRIIHVFVTANKVQFDKRNVDDFTHICTHMYTKSKYAKVRDKVRAKVRKSAYTL